MLTPKVFKTRNYVKYPGVAFAKSSAPVKKKPVVLLFGWLGASKKNLDKYSKMYNAKGYDTLSYTPPTLMTLFPWREKALSQRVHSDMSSLLRKEGYSNQDPIIAHIFSNNGYINFCFLLRFLRVHDSLLLNQLKATIIDSAPCKLDPAVLTRGFVGALFPKSSVDLEHKTFSPLFRSMFSFLLTMIPSYKRRIDDTNQLVDNSVLPTPQLFLYSRGDRMIYSTDIEEHISKIKKEVAENQIIVVDFKTSDHVSHYRAFPKEYEENIDNFLSTVKLD